MARAVKNHDKDWWRELVDLVLKEAAPTINEFHRDNFFEVAYDHFAEAGVWESYPEVVDVLEQLRPHLTLAIVSNFDGRLRVILERLGISNIFTAFSSQARSAPINRIPNSFAARSSSFSSRRTMSCTSAMIPNATGVPPLRPACRFFS